MNSLFDKPFTFDRVVRIVFGFLIFFGIVYLITLLKNALLPFLIAWLFAYMVQPIVKFFEVRLRLKSRILAIMATLFSLGAVVAILALTVFPSISMEAEKTLELLKDQDTGKGNIPFIPQAWLDYLENNIDMVQLMDFLSKENFLKALRQIAPQLWMILSNTFSVIFSITIVFVIFLYFVFILLDYEKLSFFFRNMLPRRYQPFVNGLLDDVEISMNRYFRGQSLIALCVGVLFAIGFKIIGLPLGIALGLFIGVLNLVPYLQTIGIIPMVLLSLLKSAETGENFWLIFGLSLLVLCIVQAIQDLYLTPKIMGKAMGLNPAIILLSLSVWGSLLGFIGLIIALPLTTLCLSYYKRFVLSEEEPPLDSVPDKGKAEKEVLEEKNENQPACKDH